MILHIKNMVSNRCKIIVKTELDRLVIQHGKIELGEVEIYSILGYERYECLATALMETGLELIFDKKELLIEKIKHIIINMVHYEPYLKKSKNSEYISSRANLDYTYLANIFSEEMGVTIEHFIISHKIERAKELIIANELNLTEISYLLNYSSVAHLSHQFKQVTGLTPSSFRHSPIRHRIALENI